VHLESSVFVRRPADEVWAYLGDVSNVAAWDRGVARTEVGSEGSAGVGFEFDTFAHSRGKSRDSEWGKMSYRITQTDPVQGCTVQLTSTTGNARYFKSAEWRFRVEAEGDGSRVICAAVFSLKWQYLFLAPVFLVMRRAIRNDLAQLKQALEKESGTDS
jgi:hypothetical protein